MTEKELIEETKTSDGTIPAVIDLTNDGLDWYKVTYELKDEYKYEKYNNLELEKSFIVHSRKVRAKSYSDAVKQTETYIFDTYNFSGFLEIVFIKVEKIKLGD